MSILKPAKFMNELNLTSVVPVTTNLGGTRF